MGGRGVFRRKGQRGGGCRSGGVGCGGRWFGRRVEARLCGSGLSGTSRRSRFVGTGRRRGRGGRQTGLARSNTTLARVGHRSGRRRRVVFQRGRQASASRQSSRLVEIGRRKRRRGRQARLGPWNTRLARVARRNGRRRRVASRRGGQARASFRSSGPGGASRRRSRLVLRREPKIEPGLSRASHRSRRRNRTSGTSARTRRLSSAALGDASSTLRGSTSSTWPFHRRAERQLFAHRARSVCLGGTVRGGHDRDGHGDPPPARVGPTGGPRCFPHPGTGRCVPTGYRTSVRSVSRVAAPASPLNPAGGIRARGAGHGCTGVVS